MLLSSALQIYKRELGDLNERMAHLVGNLVYISSWTQIDCCNVETREVHDFAGKKKTEIVQFSPL